jgi:hypothetical protein
LAADQFRRVFLNQKIWKQFWHFFDIFLTTWWVQVAVSRNLWRRSASTKNRPIYRDFDSDIFSIINTRLKVRADGLQLFVYTIILSNNSLMELIWEQVECKIAFRPCIGWVLPSSNLTGHAWINGENEFWTLLALPSLNLSWEYLK